MKRVALLLFAALLLAPGCTMSLAIVRSSSPETETETEISRAPAPEGKPAEQPDGQSRPGEPE